jgi:hypothetical protein
MLGGTIGNLDCREETFFSAFSTIITPQDAFLVDVPLAGPGWTPADEPRLQLDGYTPAFRRFILDGLARIEGAPVQHPKEPGRFAQQFDQKIELCHRQDPRTGAEAIAVVEKRTARILLTFRRYRWERIRTWLEEQGFTIDFSACSLRSAQDRFGMGIVLIRRN